LSPVLVISGSAHPATRAQIQRLAAHTGVETHPVAALLTELERRVLFENILSDRTRSVHVLTPAANETLPDPQWQGVARLIAHLGAELIQEIKPAALVIIGGETANHLWDELKIDAVTLLGETAPGIPCGKLVGSAVDGLPVVSKAGGFGDVDCLEQMFTDHFLLSESDC